jgi:hypothetical protein
MLAIPIPSVLHGVDDHGIAVFDRNRLLAALRLVDVLAGVDASRDYCRSGPAFHSA